MTTNTKITVVAPNCGSYFFHQYFDLPYNSPFIDLYINYDEFFPILKDFNMINFENIRRVDKDMYLRNGGENVDAEYDYPIVCLDDKYILHPMHCRSFQEFKTKWIKRVERMNFHNLLFFFTDWRYELKETDPDYRHDDLLRFNNLTKGYGRVIYTNRLVDNLLDDRTLIFPIPSGKDVMEVMKESFEDDRFAYFMNKIEEMTRV